MNQIWDGLPEQAKTDLEEWFNVKNLTGREKTRLAKLYCAGQFHAWDCPTCGERVYDGEPEDWGHFQGVQQVDHASYPGRSGIFTDEIIGRQCDGCRCRFDPTQESTREDTGL
jgi:hypothetical protein